jgi:hypothetical protein
MNLNLGLQTSLVTSLSAALNSLTHNNNPIPAFNQLNAFLNKVHAALLSSQLSTADALQLMQSAEAI